MLVSLKEISKYIDLTNISPEEIADKLTSAGIEVEGIKRIANATNLIIGEIISCEKHPNSDHLHLCKVDIGNNILNIVCGAPNARKGIKVIVAQVGAVLPKITIKKSLVAGYESEGMMCALNELGVDPSNLSKEQIEGIEELPKDAQIGNSKVLEYLGLDDVILDLSLLANRSDAYSLYNVAKEIAALFNLDVNIPSYKSDVLVDNKFEVSSNTDKCKVFSIRKYCGVKIEKSPKWLVEVLRNHGIRSINNIVDIGNYVMLLTGQPINMYDADKFTKNELVVSDEYEGDIKAFDGNIYTAQKGDLVILSDDRPMCLAGIMTSESCEVTEKTSNIIVESANFYGAQIRKTTIRIGTTSDSAQRFIKGINPNQTEFVFETISYFIKNICGYDSASKTNEYNVLNYKTKEIYCDFNYINNRLGTKFSNQTIIDSLNKLYIKTNNIDEKGFNAIIPDSRIDIESKADLSEEVLRFNGFNNIKSELPLMETTVGERSKNGRLIKIISDYLISQGLNRIITYTLINEKDNGMFNILNTNLGYEIAHPLTNDHKYIRTNLLSSILRVAEYNSNHQIKDFGLFEISQINDTKEYSVHLGLTLCGNKYEQDEIGKKPFNYYDAKGLIEEILNMFNVQNTRLKWEKFDESNEFHPNRSAKVYLDNKLFCVLGEVFPTLKNEYNFKKESVVILEMNLSVLFNTKTGMNHFTSIGTFPSVSHDYAFVINQNINYEDVYKELRKISNLITKVTLFDIYRGEHLEENMQSMAVQIIFESKDHTLNDQEITNVDAKIREMLSIKFEAEIRK